ncbi:MAG: copper amine oxidase N-terminal domain-containing protein [Syntrophomonadaceae bacterium]|nr:copper amine oxidase N-terminal domain-containing protein [Syntrophomonadaceae bacterium]
MKKTSLILVVLLISLMFCQPVLATGIGLEVNKQSLSSPELYIEKDITMAPLDFFAQISGCSHKWLSEDTVEIAGEGKKITLSIGNREVFLDGKSLQMPNAPVIKGSQFFIPLRFVCDVFDFEVNWNAEQRTVILDRVQTRDGSTAIDLLVKANQASQKFNTYDFDGTMEMAYTINADGKQMLDPPLEMITTFTGSIQNQPLQMYMKQKVSVSGEQVAEDMVMESYMHEDKMYMKAPGQEWTYMDLPFSADFFKQQQEIQSDPLKAVAQMQEMGIVCNFSDDLTLNGKDYYVINSMIDPDKFRQATGKMIEQMLPAVNPELEASNFNDFMHKMFEKMDLDYYMSAYINKKTLVSEVIKFNSRMAINLDKSDFAFVEAATDGDIPQNTWIDMTQKGMFNITGLDKSFSPPDISQATQLSFEGIN